MNLYNIEAFFFAYEGGSFSEAAKRLHIPQPTISNRIQQLEEELGEKLFIRSKKGVSLTPAGKVFLPYAQEVLATLEKAEREVKTSRSTMVRVGSALPFTLHVVKRFVHVCLATCPNLHISLQPMNPEQIITELMNHSLDAAFAAFVTGPSQKLIAKQELPGVDIHPMGSDTISVVLSPLLSASDHPMGQWPSFQNTPVILYAHLLNPDEVCQALHLSERQVITATELELVLHLVQSLGGITFLPSQWIAEQLPASDSWKTLSAEGILPVHSVDTYLMTKKELPFPLTSSVVARAVQKGVHATKSEASG